MDISFDSMARVSLDRDVAVVRVSGWTGSEQMEMLGRCLALCAREPLVRSVCLVINSRGGHEFGIPDIEPVIAQTAKAIAGKGGGMAVHVEGQGASGGYMLACVAARASGARISASPAAVLGSIGAVIVLDGSEELAKKSGQQIEVVSTGPLKGAGVYGTPITDELRKQARAIVDDNFGRFRDLVISARNLSQSEFAAVSTGGVWPAREAMRLKLIDEVVTLPEVVSRLAALPVPSRPGDVPATFIPETGQNKDEPMSTPTTPTASATPTATPATANAAATPATPTTPTASATPTATPATAAQLKAEFGADAAFCFQQIEAGATMEQARAAWSVKSAAVIGDLSAKVQDLTAKVEDLTRARKFGTPVSSVPGQEAAAGAGQGAQTVEQFEAAAKVLSEASKISPLAAVARLARKPEHAAGYAAWRKARGLVD